MHYIHIAVVDDGDDVNNWRTLFNKFNEHIKVAAVKKRILEKAKSQPVDSIIKNGILLLKVQEVIFSTRAKPGQELVQLEELASILATTFLRSVENLQTFVDRVAGVILLPTYLRASFHSIPETMVSIQHYKLVEIVGAEVRLLSTKEWLHPFPNYIFGLKHLVNAIGDRDAIWDRSSRRYAAKAVCKKD